MCVSLFLVLSFTVQVSAYESFTLNVSFYQGVDVNHGVTEIDPTLLTLIFGDTQQVELVLDPPDAQNPFDFSPAVDFSFAYDPIADDPIVLAPGNIAAIAVLEEPAFEAIDVGILGKIEFEYDFSAIALNSAATVLLLTEADTYIKIGNVVPAANLTLEFEYQQLTAAESVPEPATLLLLRLGLIGAAGLIKRRLTPNLQGFNL